MVLPEPSYWMHQHGLVYRLALFHGCSPDFRSSTANHSLHGLRTLAKVVNPFSVTG